MKHAFKTGAVILITLTMLFCVACPKRPEKVDIDKRVTSGYKVNVVGEVTFTYNVTNDEEKLSPDAFIRAFEKMYPDAHVNKDYSAGDVAARVASGDIGDVFHFAEESTYNWAVTNDALMPIDVYLEPLGIDITEIYAGILDLGNVNGRLYMASRDYNHIILFTNTGAIKAEGLQVPLDLWTWDQFIDNYAPKLVKLNDDGTYAQVPMNLKLDYDPIYIPFMEGWGGTWYDDVNKTISLTSDEKVLQGISAMIKAAEDGFLHPTCATSTEITSKYKNLENYNYVFRYLVYPTLYSAGTEYDNYGIEWDLVSFPHFPSPAVGTGSSGYGVYNRTKRPDTAAALALFFFTEEGQKAYNGQTGGSVPLIKSLADDNFWRGEGTPWEGKNYNAFVSFPEADTVGQVQCRVPPPVASLIDGGPWSNMLKNHFNDTKDYVDSLRQMEELANQKWAKISEEVIGD